MSSKSLQTWYYVLIILAFGIIWLGGDEGLGGFILIIALILGGILASRAANSENIMAQQYFEELLAKYDKHKK